MALVAVMLSLLLVELAVRIAVPGKLKKPMLVIPGAETTVPLSQITILRPLGGSDPGNSLSDRFRPYLFMKGWYDDPEWAYFDEHGFVDYVFNRYGLRDDDFEREKQPDEYRVIAMGDSFTFGTGVQLEDCWTEVLQAGLAERLGRPAVVINAGLASGHMPSLYEHWIEPHALGLEPDLLMVALCLNDMHRDVKLYAFEDPDPPAWWGDRSALLTTIGKLWARWRSPPPRPIDFTRVVEQDPSRWQEGQAALLRMRDMLEGHGIRFMIVIQPMLSGLQIEYPYAGLTAMVRAFCEAEGIEYVDLTPRFLDRPERELWVHPTDQHPNHRGHRLIAEGILDYLVPR